ncbi:MAG: tryptophanase [Myxococcota bacterium]|nr:tryptophanase [Myxococcota bacterium]
MSWPWKTIIEPFRIKSVEAIPLLNRPEREAALREARYNLFKLPASVVTIDMLTDSGTGAMSAAQWEAIMRGDESYAGSRSFYELDAVVKRISGMPEVLPVHQGRAAERILARTMLRDGGLVVSNTHFDTTRANVEQAGAEAMDLPVDQSGDHPFKGDMDLPRLKEILSTREVKLVLMTLTNNAVGGQPVSMANLQAVSALCREAGVPMFMDAARFAENAWFVREREQGWKDHSCEQIARAAFDLCDGLTMSAKKDAIVNIGGLLACRDPELATMFRNQLILGEGFPTYGGLAGRDMAAMAVGLLEALDENYLRYRARSVEHFANALQGAGVPVVTPPGGHAVYLDAGALLSHLKPAELPGVALGNALYLEGGVRGVEIGSLMFDGAPRELLRLAMPRRVYTEAHIHYVVEVAAKVVAQAAEIRPMRIVEAPDFLRHFSAALEPVD